MFHWTKYFQHLYANTKDAYNPTACPSLAAVACDVHSANAQMQTQHPNTFIVITGDFNHVSLDKTLPTFHQYVDCPTRDDNWIFHMQMLRMHTVPQPSAPLGRSDHNLVLLTPRYVPLVQQQPVHTRSMGLRRLLMHYRTALSRQTGMYLLSHMERISTA